MRFEAWRKRRKLSRRAIADALGVSHNSLNRLGNGEPPTLRRAALLHYLSDGEIGYEDMLPTGFLRTEMGRIDGARRELGLD